jgi:gamma-glutamyl-gamma-aminobutyrate hydrolase PuuD
MTGPLLVGVLGSRIGSPEAAQIGYGNRELDLYQTGCIEPMYDAGMLPLGVASVDVASGLDLCDLVSAFIVPHGGRIDAGAGNQSGDDYDQSGLPIVIGALARNLPILAIGSGECLVAAALSGQPAHPATETTFDRHGARDADRDGGSDLAELLGVATGRNLPVLMGTTNMPSGMWVAASGPDGSVYAVVTNERSGGQVLSIRWDPGSLPSGDQAREGPFRWLRDQAANSRPRAQPEGHEHPSVRQEVQ